MFFLRGQTSFHRWPALKRGSMIPILGDITTRSWFGRAKRRNHLRNHLVPQKEMARQAANRTKLSAARENPLLNSRHHVIREQFLCPIYSYSFVVKKNWRLKFDAVRQRFRLTPTEKRVVVFVLAAFMLGLITKCYRDAHPSPPPPPAKGRYYSSDDELREICGELTGTSELSTVSSVQARHALSSPRYARGSR